MASVHMLFSECSFAILKTGLIGLSLRAWTSADLTEITIKPARAFGEHERPTGRRFRLDFVLRFDYKGPRSVAWACRNREAGCTRNALRLDHILS